jgi:exopolysaccharide production protein ExoY
MQGSVLSQLTPAGDRCSDSTTLPPGQAAGGVRPSRCGAFYLSVKRLFDLPLVLVGGLLLLPVLLAVALAVRITSPGPALFRQQRVGRGGRLFGCYKFRTMRVDAEEILERDEGLRARYIANDFKLPEGEDPRLTPIGRLLRKTSLDELPQMINVLAGDMSLVGPRPVVPAELQHYAGREAEFLSALPGITGRWQVGGRSTVNYPERAECELEYIYTWSLWQDVVIMARTVGAVLRGTGAH